MNYAFIASELTEHSPLGGLTPGSSLHLAYLIFGLFMIVIVVVLKIWRGDKISRGTGDNSWWRYRGIRGVKGALKDTSSLSGKAELDWTTPTNGTSMCQRCGIIVRAGAITCPACGSTLRVTNDKTNQVQAQDGLTQTQTLSDSKCPFCGFMLAAGVNICPKCNWRLHGTAGTTAESPPRIGVVRQDVIVGGSLAFKKDEWVKIEGESPDPDRPEYKYVVLSRTLDKRFRLSDRDLAV